MFDNTMPFSIKKDKEMQMKEILVTVYDALKEKGYNPLNQIVGYILSEDPTYITNHNNARALIPCYNSHKPQVSAQELSVIPLRLQPH